MSKLRIWTNYPPLAPNAALLREILPDHSILMGSKAGDDPSLNEVDIAFGQPTPQKIFELKGLKWIHVNTAGYTNYDREDVRAALRARGAILTNSSMVYCEPCAQHALALILSHARKLLEPVLNQHGPRQWPMNDIRARSVVLSGQTALLLGFGAIGRRLAELLAPLRMKVIALRKNVRGDESVETHPISALDNLLPAADHVINLLPLSDSTARLFDAGRFSRMKRSAIFYNIGRGDTVDQPALQAALTSGSLSAACLDVMTPEPLPPDHPLWTTPNCFITPHTAGGHHDEVQRVVDHFVQNLQRFERGEKMEDQVI